MRVITPKVSVIVPVYNTAEFLREALDSLVAQTLPNIQIICVNDGSTDGSDKVLEEYSDRIVIITKANGGQASARNDAMDIASGEYVYFMDSDDYIEPDTLERCVGICDRDNLDFAFFDADTFGDSSWFDYDRASRYTGIRSGCETMLQMLKDGTYRCTICMSVFRRSFLTGNGIRFYPGIIHEDELYSALVYFNAKRIESVPEKFYHRRMRGSSTMTTGYSKRNVRGYLTCARELTKYPCDTPLLQETRKAVISSFMQALTDNSWKLGLFTRLRIANVILFRYPYAFRFKAFFSLLLKKYLRLFSSARSN